MSLQGLTLIMDKLIKLHRTLLELSELKTSILVKNQMDDLNQIVNKETNIIKQIMQADQRRIEEISEFLIEKGFKPNPKITVKDLIKLVYKADEKQALGEKQELLLSMITQLQELNVRNQKLIEQSLLFINYTLDLVYGPPEDNVVYHKPSNHQQGTKRANYFDSRA